MIPKRDVLRYALVGAILIVLLSILIVLRGGVKELTTHGITGLTSLENSTIQITGQLEIDFENITSYSGANKKIPITIKNTGPIFLNNCILTAEGEISPWIYSEFSQGIAPGETLNFIFNLNIPEETKNKDYFGIIKIECEEITKSKEIKVTLKENTNKIKINQIEQEKDNLNITYTFDNSDFIGNQISIMIQLLNESNSEILNQTDIFPINKEPPIKRNIIIEIPKNLIGFFDLQFTIQSDKQNPIKQSIILGSSSTTGNAILEASKQKIAGYIVFSIMITAGLFFSLRGSIKKFLNSKKSPKNPKNKKPSKLADNKEQNQYKKLKNHSFK